MPSHNELPGYLPRRKLVKALRGVGFKIDTAGGKGNHVKITWPATQKSITIPSGVEKQTLRYVLKEIELYSGITWDQIRGEL